MWLVVRSEDLGETRSQMDSSLPSMEWREQRSSSTLPLGLGRYGYNYNLKLSLVYH